MQTFAHSHLTRERFSAISAPTAHPAPYLGELEVGKVAKKKFTWIARHSGVEIGRITTHVPYSHALVQQVDEAAERARAYATEPDEFDHQLWTNWQGRREGHFATFESMCAHNRQEEISRFESMPRAIFQPYVAKWLRPEDVAACNPTAANVKSWYSHNYKVAKIVPVESEETVSVAQRVAKLAKPVLRDVLADVCNKMIERKAWDEIAHFLVAQLGPEDTPLVLKLVRGGAR